MSIQQKRGIYLHKSCDTWPTRAQTVTSANNKCHPCRRVRLFQSPSSWQRLTSIEHTNIIQSQESTLENIVPIGILSVDPPSKVQQQLLKDAFEEFCVLSTMHFAFDVVGSPDGPSVQGRIDIGEIPFVGWDLTVGMEIPFAGEDIELFLCKLNVDHGERDAMERRIPGGEERIFPFVGLQSELWIWGMDMG
jgi:hypothetical protein